MSATTVPANTAPLATRVPLVVGVLLVVAPVLRLITYHPAADGDWRDFARATIFSLTLAAATWALVRRIAPRRSITARVLPWCAALAVLVPGDAVHFLRLSHPAARSGEVVVREAPRWRDTGKQTLAGRWHAELQAGAAIELDDGVLHLRNDPGAIGYVDLRLPDRWNVRNIPYWLPRILASDAPFDETLEWRAAVEVRTAYYVLLDTKNVLIQATPFGLHIMYPDESGRITEHHIEALQIADAQTHHYVFERASGLLRLRLDEHPVWVRPDTGAWGHVRFGETRSDALHGGSLRLAGVGYTRRHAAES